MADGKVSRKLIEINPIQHEPKVKIGTLSSTNKNEQKGPKTPKTTKKPKIPFKSNKIIKGDVKCPPTDFDMKHPDFVINSKGDVKCPPRVSKLGEMNKNTDFDQILRGDENSPPQVPKPEILTKNTDFDIECPDSEIKLKGDVKCPPRSPNLGMIGLRPKGREAGPQNFKRLKNL